LSLQHISEERFESTIIKKDGWMCTSMVDCIVHWKGGDHLKFVLQKPEIRFSTASSIRIHFELKHQNH
jgi:hypothetical protein